MGNTTTKKKTQEEKKISKETISQAIAERKEKISASKNKIASTRESIESLPNGIELYKVQQDALVLLSVGEEQLQREGQPFTKRDYISIILALDKKNLSSLEIMKKLSVEDLRSKVRLMIYDVGRYVDTNKQPPPSDEGGGGEQRISKV